jgi:hypothetical protein
MERTVVTAAVVGVFGRMLCAGGCAAAGSVSTLVTLWERCLL